METKQLYDGNNTPFYPRVAGGSSITIGGGVIEISNTPIINIAYDDNNPEKIYTIGDDGLSNFNAIILYDVRINIDGNEISPDSFSSFDDLYALMRKVLSLRNIINIDGDKEVDFGNSVSDNFKSNTTSYVIGYTWSDKNNASTGYEWKLLRVYDIQNLDEYPTSRLSSVICLTYGVDSNGINKISGLVYDKTNSKVKCINLELDVK